MSGNDIVDTQFDLTAEPLTLGTVSRSQILATTKALVGWFTTIQNANGSFQDPSGGTNTAQEAACFTYGGATLVAAGDTTYLSQTVAAMNWTAANYAATGGTSTDGPEFEMAPLAKAYALLAASGKVSASQLATWAKQLNTIKDTPYNDGHNWGAYAMDGMWQMAKAGLISTSTAQAGIENLWNTYQKNDFDPTTGLYKDGTSPDSMAVENAGRGRILDMLESGYNGPSAAAMWADVLKGSETALATEDPSGQAATGGRTNDHVWVDTGAMSINEALAQSASDPTLAGQYQEAADLTFNEELQWQNANGSFSVTKNFYPSSERVGYQTASQVGSYNANVLLGLAESYNADVKTVTPVAAQSQIGGYSFYTGSDWGTAFANAGGTAIEVELRGDTSSTFSNYWSALGIDRIGSVGWDTELGPSDGRYNGSAGVSFAPAWQTSSGAWTNLANHPGTYAGTYTTIMASPVLTKVQIVWAPTSGNSGPTFTQSLTITPDGILSQVTEQGSSATFGMTFPLIHDNGKTTFTQTIANGIASVTDGTSTESFIDLNANATLTAEPDVLSSYGNLTPVEATGNGSEMDTFVYQSNAGDPSAASVQSGLTLTATGYTSSLGWVNGTLYAGRTSAGGYGSSIALSGSGTPDVTLSKACNFILQLSNGKITAIETDTNVTALVEGQTVSLTAYTSHSFGSGISIPSPSQGVVPNQTPTPVTPTVTVAEPSSLVVGTDTLAGKVTGSPGSVELAWSDASTVANGSSSFVKVTVASDGTFSVPVSITGAGTQGALWADIDGTVSKLWSATPSAATTSTPPTPTTTTPTITVTQPSPLVAGTDTLTGTVTGNPTLVELAWHTTGNETDGASDFVKVSVNADGTFSVPIVIDHPGTQSTLWADVNHVVTKLWSATPVTATPTTSTPTPASTGSSAGASASTTPSTSSTSSSSPLATDPTPVSITVSLPTTLTAGTDTFTGTVTGSPKSVELAWHNTGNEVDGASDFVKVSVSSNGTFSVPVMVDHPGQQGSLWADIDGAVTKLSTTTPVFASGTSSSASMSFTSSSDVVLPASGAVTVSSDLASGIIDLRAAMAKAGWDKSLSDLSKYVTTASVDGGADLQVSVHAASSAAFLVATLDGLGNQTLTTLETHALLS